VTGSDPHIGRSNDDRRELLLSVLHVGPGFRDAVSALRVLQWDSEPLIVLTLDDTRAILERHEHGGISDDDLELWADALEVRDDVNLEFTYEELLRQCLFELSTPALSIDGIAKLAHVWRERLAVARAATQRDDDRIAVLWSAIEDYPGLYDFESELRSIRPAGQSTRELARTLVREMLIAGELRLLAPPSELGVTGAALDIAEALAAVELAQNWEPAATEDAAVRLTATETGEEAYRDLVDARTTVAALRAFVASVDGAGAVLNEHERDNGEILTYLLMADLRRYFVQLVQAGKCRRAADTLLAVETLAAHRARGVRDVVEDSFIQALALASDEPEHAALVAMRKGMGPETASMLQRFEGREGT
jgi:hypothetical protein